MQSNTDVQKDRKKSVVGAVVCAAVMIVILTAVLIAYLSIMALELGVWGVVAVIGVYAAMIAAAIICILVALRQRLKELGSDEYAQSKQY